MFENIQRKYNSDFSHQVEKDNWERIKAEWRRYNFLDYRPLESLITELEAEWNPVSNIDYSKFYKLDAEREASGKDEIWEAKKKWANVPLMTSLKDLMTVAPHRNKLSFGEADSTSQTPQQPAIAEHHTGNSLTSINDSGTDLQEPTGQPPTALTEPTVIERLQPGTITSTAAKETPAEGKETAQNMVADEVLKRMEYRRQFLIDLTKPEPEPNEDERVEDVAMLLRWGAMPFTELIDELKALTGERGIDVYFRYVKPACERGLIRKRKDGNYCRVYRANRPVVFPAKS